MSHYDDFFRRSREEARHPRSTSHDAPSIATVYTERHVTVRYPDPSKGPGYPAWKAENEWQESTDRSLEVAAEEPWVFTIRPARPLTVVDHVSDITRSAAKKFGIPPEILKAHMQGRNPLQTPPR